VGLLHEIILYPLSGAATMMKRIALLLTASLFLTACAEKYTVYPVGVPCIYPLYGKNFGIGEDGYQVYVDRVVYEVPTAFITDLASIPRPLWIFTSLLEFNTIGASILHDYFYSGRPSVTRKYADDVFYNHMIHDGAHPIKAWCFWVGVRMFGWYSFRG